MQTVSKKYFPDEKTLADIREKYSESNVAEFTLALSPSASQSERAKYEVCQYIARYLREHNLKQDDLASMMGVNKSRVSEIIHGKVKHFTLDRLIGYSEKLTPDLKVLIRLAA